MRHLEAFLHSREQALYLCLRLGIHQVANEYLRAQRKNEFKTVAELWIIPINLSNVRLENCITAI